MAWIFQGNPARYDIDGYLSRYPQRIYWYTNRYIHDISIGDVAFIWRAGSDAGAVAIGHVVELPTPVQSVKFPEALGSDLWKTDEEAADGLKTGIELTDIRLTVDEGMVSRTQTKADSVLRSSTIIRIPNGTVFRLENEEFTALTNLWGLPVGTVPHASAIEGQRQLRSHYVRERSSRLRHDKLQAFRQKHGGLHCEVCGFSKSAQFPAPFTDRAFEVHHKKPLADAEKPVQTLLNDLAVLCANCHRTVHSNSEVEKNYSLLVGIYEKKS
ncbi:EVE domain-containing protein [Amphritea opalescens]|uniref:EVE domain-containing protein n=1 Tax=Amphritea opalescens TaxID=2490544 RepID=A0A430KS31_9GAMM|nr:HNH endonuclease [Amphritea opalescens]RTE66321.1 EVE domain-containing protein [Amphritea opalescens]